MNDVCSRDPVLLTANDLSIFLKLLPRAQIVVGDIPQIEGALRRLVEAVATGKAFLEVVDGPEA
jgi:hypothetical protein